MDIPKIVLIGTKLNRDVPQGWILGPLFFLLYSNNLPYIINNISKLTLFTYDTSVTFSNSNSIDYNNIIIQSIVLSRKIGCLWVLSTSVYRLLRTSVHSSSYLLPWLLIFSSYFSVFLSSCFPEDSKVVHSLVSVHPLFLMCDQSIQIFFFLFVHLYLPVLLLSIDLCWK